MSNRGSKFHPSRVSGHQKFLRAKIVNEEMKKLKKEKPMRTIDLKKADLHKQI